MLDVDFLCKSNHSFKQCILYKFQEGTFRAEVTAKIFEIFSNKGIQLRLCEKENFEASLKENSLLGESLVVVDLISHKKYVDYTFKYLSSKYSNKYLILINDIPEEYKIISKSFTIIEEVKLTKSKVKKILSFLFKKNSLLMDYQSVTNLMQFQTSLEDMVETEKINLSEFVNRFEFYSVLCFQEGLFDVMTFKSLMDSQKIDYFKFHKLLCNLLINPSPQTKVKFFREIENEVSNNVAVKSIVANLFRVVRELSFINTNLNKSGQSGFSEYKKLRLKQFEAIPVKSLLRFQLLLAKHEAKFNMGNFSTELDKFLAEV